MAGKFVQIPIPEALLAYLDPQGTGAEAGERALILIIQSLLSSGDIDMKTAAEITGQSEEKLKKVLPSQGAGEEEDSQEELEDELMMDKIMYQYYG